MNRNLPTCLRREDGFALILILWVSVIVVAVAFEFASSMRIEARIARNHLDETRNYFLARSGFELAKAEIQRRNEYIWINRNRSLSERQEETHRFWNLDGTENRVQLGNDTIRTWILPEESKIDLNKSNPALLRGLLEAADIDPRDRSIIVDSILDWKDGDNLHRINGAENDYYESLSPPYQARNAPFESVEELLLVRGVGESVLYRPLPRKTESEDTETEPSASSGRPLRLIDCLTVHNRGGRINLNFAPEPVLRSIPYLTPGLVARILQLRKERGNEFLSERDYRLVLGDETFSAIQPYVSYGRQASVFTIRSQGKSGEEGSQEIQALIRVSYGNRKHPFQVIGWLDSTY